MTYKDIITQLESLKSNSESFMDESEPGDVWSQDIIALDRAIQIFKRKERKSSDLVNKFLFLLNGIIFIVTLFMLHGNLGAYQIDSLTKQEFLFRLLTSVILICLSTAGLIMAWRGVDE